MRTAVHLKEKSPASSDLAQEYRSALEECIARADEASLGRAYELGRRALAEGKSLMEMVCIHHEAFREVVFGGGETDESRKRALQASADFLTESLSPYEMAHRGFQDAAKALRQMNERLEEQFKGIAYAVHDEAGQLLVAVHLALASLATELPKPQQEQIVQIEGLLNEVEKQLRQYSHELRPTVLDDLGWIPALRFLAESVSKRANLPIHVDAELTIRLPAPVETAIYRVVQEALNNAVKHSGATSIAISARKEGNTLCCSVHDDGAGFDSAVIRAQLGRKGLGLTAMQERLNAVGGTLLIESAPGKGTQLQFRLPLEDSNADPNRACR
jgi:signal transduction histidine kinase